MTGKETPAGAIFHAQSKRRREVRFTPSLRQQTEAAIRRLRALLDAGVVPRAELKPQCDGCSLHEICLPELSDALRAAAGNLFSTSE